MANGRMNFDQFDDEMDYIPKEFSRGGNKEKKKVLKMKKEGNGSAKKTKGNITGERRRYEKTYDEFDIKID